MFGSAFKVARVWGIPIKIHWSLLALVAFLVMSAIKEGAFAAIPILLLLSFCVFTSIALHELGHSFVAIRKGCRVREITLMFMGGAAQMERLPSKPKDEFLVAIAGPTVSVALGLLLWSLGVQLPDSIVRKTGLSNTFIQYLGMINIWLALFNLIPAFPMDGGRVFRAALTPRLGRLRATQKASSLGKFLAVVFGLYAAIPPMNFIYIAIAFFIYVSASNEYRQVQMQEAARHYGFGSWSPFDFGADTGPGDDDKVTISPPPYKKGPDTETEIRPDDDGPFGGFFGKSSGR